MSIGSCIAWLTALAFTVSVCVADNSIYGSALCASGEMNVVKAYWPLEDLMTYDGHVTDRVNVFCPPASVPMSRNPAYIHHNGGSVQFRLDDSRAVSSKAIGLSYPAYLEFPLSPVRSGPPAADPGSQFFSIMGWFYYDTVSSPSLSDPTPLFSVWTGGVMESASAMVTTSELSFGGQTVGHVESSATWHLLAVVVTETTTFTTVDFVVDGTLVGSFVQPSVAWEGSSFRLSAPMWSSVVFDEVSVSASFLSVPQIGQLFALGNRGACIKKPCFSGTQCTPLSSMRFSCGSCPAHYTGDGITCSISASGLDYNCLRNSHLHQVSSYCSSTCGTRAGCFECTMALTGTVDETAGRALCNGAFAQHSSTPTVSTSATESVAPTTSRTSSRSMSITVSSSMTSTISESSSQTNTMSISTSASSTVPPSVSSLPSVTPSTSATVTPYTCSCGVGTRCVYIFGTPRCDATNRGLVYGGHYYFTIGTLNSDWNAAVSNTYSLGGHIATAASSGEALALANFHKTIYPLSEIWLGGYQKIGSSEPTGGWSWVTGETWWADWDNGEPSNSGSIEHVIFMYTNGKMNDFRATGSTASIGWFTEYDFDATVPPTVSGCSSCGAGTRCVAGPGGTGGIRCDTTANSGFFNGHYYLVVTSTVVPESANIGANSLGGHLASITSSGENAFVRSLINTAIPSQMAFVGLIQRQGYTEPGQWTWTTAETMPYTNWSASEPNNSGTENYGAMQSTGLWTDEKGTITAGYVVEFDTTVRQY